MSGQFAWIISTFGQEMICYDPDGGERGRGMALVQPMTGTDWQRTAGPLGSRSEDRFRALADPALPVGEGDVAWGGSRYEVMAVHPITVGGRVTHLWMALCPAREAAL